MRTKSYRVRRAGKGALLFAVLYAVAYPADLFAESGRSVTANQRRAPLSRTASTTRPSGESLDGGRNMASATSGLSPDLERVAADRDRMFSSSSASVLERGRMTASGTDERGSRPLGAHHGEVFRHASGLVLMRMKAVIGRYERISDRIDSRIAKSRSAGTDVSRIESEMRTVRVRIADAKVAVLHAEQVANDASDTIDLGTSTPADDPKRVAKEALASARRTIVAIDSALREAYATLSGARRSIEEATSTDASGTPDMAR